MTEVFTDTSYYIALLNSADADHAIAVDFRSKFSGRYITTRFVLIELGNWLSQVNQRRLFVRLADALSTDPKTTIISATEEWTAKGLQLYRNRYDKNWSFTDCISFAVMTELKLQAALSADHHFEQAGFTALLK